MQNQSSTGGSNGVGYNKYKIKKYGIYINLTKNEFYSLFTKKDRIVLRILNFIAGKSFTIKIK